MTCDSQMTIKVKHWLKMVHSVRQQTPWGMSENDIATSEISIAVKLLGSGFPCWVFQALQNHTTIMKCVSTRRASTKANSLIFSDQVHLDCFLTHFLNWFKNEESLCLASAHRYLAMWFKNIWTIVSLTRVSVTIKISSLTVVTACPSWLMFSDCQ